MTEEFEVSYEAKLDRPRDDPEYLTAAAAEVQEGIRHLLTAVSALGAALDPERVTVEPVDHPDEDAEGHRVLRRGLFIRAYVTKGTTDPRFPKERYQSYRKGWRDGAGTKAMDKRFTEHSSRPDLKAEYERGYAAGHAALGQAMKVACERLGHEPSVLRTQGETLTEEDLEDAYVAVVAGPHLKTVREIVAAGTMDGKTLRPTLVKVADLVAAGKEEEARAYVAKVSAENKARE